MEKFCLKWNDFQKNIGNSFRELQLSSDFSDVTLVDEEGQQVEAHKIILSACSPFFRSVLWKNKHLHPMIYMRGLKSKDLLAVVDFIYQGETNVMQEDLDGFLALADELQLQGLTRRLEENSQDNLTAETDHSTQIKQKIPLPLTKVPRSPINLPKEEIFDSSMNESNEKCLSLDDVDQEDFEIKNSNTLVTLESANALDEQIASMMTKSIGLQGWTCSRCDKSFKQKSNVMSHIESNHIEGATHPCNLCGKVSRSRGALRKHIERQHDCNK